LFHADRQTKREADRHEEADRSFSQFWGRPYKVKIICVLYQ
jgi:hypothetical protein